MIHSLLLGLMNAYHSVALELLVQGFNVILHGRNEEKLERVRTELFTKHPTFVYIALRCNIFLFSVCPKVSRLA